jgi:hypothetical protein
MQGVMGKFNENHNDMFSNKIKDKIFSKSSLKINGNNRNLKNGDQKPFQKRGDS